MKKLKLFRKTALLKKWAKKHGIKYKEIKAVRTNADDLGGLLSKDFIYRVENET